MRQQKGFTLLELLFVVAIVGVIAAVAIPSLLRGRMAANEAAAIGALRAIASGQAAYASSCAGGGYAATLDDLAKGPAGSAGFIGPDLATNGVTKSGYTLTVSSGVEAKPVTPVARTCNGSAADAVSIFFAKADPVQLGRSGNRYFATDSKGVIFQDTAASLAEPLATAGTVQPVQSAASADGGRLAMGR